MAVHEKNRFIRFYHAVVAILLLLAGGALLGAGIWLQVTDNAGPLNLEYTGSNVFDWVVHFGIAVIIIGIFLIAAAIASLLALGRKCVGATFKVIYIVLALVILAALVFITVVSIIILANDDTKGVRDFLSDAWNRTVEENPDEVCRVEKHFECRGFEDNDCVGCEKGTEPGCGNKACARCDVPAPVSVGCYDEIIGSVHRFYLPLSIVAGVLSLIVLIDIFITCAL